jgi:hypothetical protein
LKNLKIKELKDQKIKRLENLKNKRGGVIMGRGRFREIEDRKLMD